MILRGLWERRVLALIVLHGAIVNLDTADRIGFGLAPNAEFLVLATAVRAAAVTASLREQGLTVLSSRNVDDLRASFAGEGPGLELVLPLAAALAAAVLALGRTVLALHTAAKRRGYELAALEAAGAKVSALRQDPAVRGDPVTPPLPHAVAAGPVALVIGLALLLSLLAAVLTSELLLRGIKVERLREAPA